MSSVNSSPLSSYVSHVTRGFIYAVVIGTYGGLPVSCQQSSPRSEAGCHGRDSAKSCHRSLPDDRLYQCRLRPPSGLVYRLRRQSADCVTFPHQTFLPRYMSDPKLSLPSLLPLIFILFSLFLSLFLSLPHPSHLPLPLSTLSDHHAYYCHSRVFYLQEEMTPYLLSGNTCRQSVRDPPTYSVA